MVIDPVCHMSINPDQAKAEAEYGGARYYFCSTSCHQRFVASPDDYVKAGKGAEATKAKHPREAPYVTAAAAGLSSIALLLVIYFGILVLVSGWEYTREQFSEFWPYIIVLATGFGMQVSLFVHLRHAVHKGASGKVVAATGTTSGAAMVSCCTHYLVNILPALGATGLLTFISQYQIELFWFGIAANVAGIAYLVRKLAMVAVVKGV